MIQPQQNIYNKHVFALFDNYICHCLEPGYISYIENIARHTAHTMYAMYVLLCSWCLSMFRVSRSTPGFWMKTVPFWAIVGDPGSGSWWIDPPEYWKKWIIITKLSCGFDAKCEHVRKSNLIPMHKLLTLKYFFINLCLFFRHINAYPIAALS